MKGHAVTTCTKALAAGGKILVCGGGASSVLASQFAALLVIRLNKNRVALPCINLSADQCVLTACIANFGYEHTFERQLEAFGRKGDVLIAVSARNGDAAINRAIAQAHVLEMVVLEPERALLETESERHQTHLRWLHELAEGIEDAYPTIVKGKFKYIDFGTGKEKTYE